MSGPPEYTGQLLLDLLATFDVGDYAKQVDRVGRRELANDSGLVRRITDLALSCAADDSADPLVRTTVGVAHAFLEAQRYILTAPTPRYEPYVGLPLLRLVLGVDSGEEPLRTRDQIWFAFNELLAGAIDYETSALAAPDGWYKRQFDQAVSRDRVEALEAVQAIVPRREVVPYGDCCTLLRDVAAEPTGVAALRHLLVFPQTTFHDEVAFQYLILLTECLFWGALTFVRPATVAIGAGEQADALDLLRVATEFAAVLIKVFHAVRVMPPMHFRAFRDATGQASAVQSQSWQLLDAHVYGVLPEKMAALRRNPEVQHVLDLADSGFTPLVRLVEQVGTDDVYAQARMLDNALRAWRKFHEHRLAGRSDPGYLPQQTGGTGGTAGFSYLAAQHPPRFGRQRGPSHE